MHDKITILDLSKGQLPPVPGNGSITDSFIWKAEAYCNDFGLADLGKKLKEIAEVRREHGFAKYGMELQTENGRNVFIDIFQEQFDKTLYALQAVMEDKLDSVYFDNCLIDLVFCLKMVYRNDGKNLT